MCNNGQDITKLADLNYKEENLMSDSKPINPQELQVGDEVQWVESDGDVWDVEVKDIRAHGILVDSGYGKSALFAPSSEDARKYVLHVGDMEMEDYIRVPQSTKSK